VHSIQAKKILVIALLIIAVAISLWVTLKNLASTSSSPSFVVSLPANNVSNALPITVTPSQSAKPLPTQISLQKYETLMGAPAQASEVKDWYVRRGNYAFSDGNREYASYNQDALEKLSANGDIRAMHALANMYLDETHLHHYDADAANLQYRNAAVYGSTQALADLAVDHQVRFFSHETNEQAKKAAGLEVLALYNVAELRGDKWANLNEGLLFKRGMTISVEDQQYINTRSQQIYDELQQNRNELGLGEFDNSVPDAVKHFFEQLEFNPI